MDQRLVIVSDMWGAKKGLWITSYLGYLQQYYDITFYDSQHLGNIDVTINTPENIHNAFFNDGVATAAAHLLKRETVPCHYLAFGVGGDIVWQAALMGLPMKTLYAVSVNRICTGNMAPDTPIKLIYGSTDRNRPSEEWSPTRGVNVEVVENFGPSLYSDEKIIRKICLEILTDVTHRIKKAV